MRYSEMTSAQLKAEEDRVQAEYRRLLGLNLKLNLARGKPETAQLALSDAMPETLRQGYVVDGEDVRNYGDLQGLPACRRLFGEILGVSPDEVLIGGNASLNLMYDLIAKAYTHGLRHSITPWSKEPVVRFLCPYPGYDRHFNISLSFGMELIPVPLMEDGPDMSAVARCAGDPSVKGMWCVPKYSNPDGYIYSEGTCRKLAAMEFAAPDFALMWDNAYCIHTIQGEDEPFLDMLSLCREAGHPDRAYEFASTSKITFAGAGVSCMASSTDNIKHILGLMQYQTIGFNKVDQLMHVRFLQDRAHTLEHMKKHAAILAPKFEAVLKLLDEEIEPAGIAAWNKPKGGYFISLNAMPGTAKRALELTKAAGVSMTGAGATYPGGIDPMDTNIRIAPSYPPLDELKAAMAVFCTALKLAALEKLMEK